MARRADSRSGRRPRAGRPGKDRAGRPRRGRTPTRSRGSGTSRKLLRTESTTVAPAGMPKADRTAAGGDRGLSGDQFFADPPGRTRVRAAGYAIAARQLGRHRSGGGQDQVGSAQGQPDHSGPGRRVPCGAAARFPRGSPRGPGRAGAPATAGRARQGSARGRHRAGHPRTRRRSQDAASSARQPGLRPSSGRDPDIRTGQRAGPAASLPR